MKRGSSNALVTVGVLTIVLGIAVTIDGQVTNARFVRDPVCTRSISLETPASTGPTCSIVSGTISKKYQTSDSGRRASEFHIVVLTNRNATLDLSLHAASGSPLYVSAAPGQHAVVETVNGAPAFIATSAGMLPASGDPSNFGTVGLIVAAFGAIVTLIATRFRSRSATSDGRRYRS